MNDIQQKQLGSALWGIADKLRGTMNADDFRDYMLSFLFLRILVGIGISHHRRKSYPCLLHHSF